MLDDVTEKPSNNGLRDADEPRKHSLAARLLAAKLFSYLGIITGFIGIPLDMAALVKEPNLNFFQKVGKGFTGKNYSQLNSTIRQIHQIDGIFNRINAYMRLTKYTLITSMMGTLGGAYLGWTRGGLIEKGSDIYKHPIRSTKIVLGLEKPPEAEVKKPVASMEMASEQPAPREWGKAVRDQATAAELAEPQRS